MNHRFGEHGFPGVSFEFRQHAQQVLGPMLSQYGYSATDTGPHGARFVRPQDATAIETSYDRSSQFFLTSAVSLERADGRTYRAGLGWALPEAMLNHIYPPTFSNDAQALDGALARLLPLMKQYGPQLWDNPERIVQVHYEILEKSEHEHQAQERKSKISQARFAYEKGNYQRAIDQYVLAGGDLTARDRRSLYIARKTVASQVPDHSRTDE